MRAIKSKDSQPELAVRSILHSAGYRFRLHRGDLPGRPDLVLPKYKAVVLVHGCFWHCHSCQDGHVPKSRVGYWADKLATNVARDRKNIRDLCALGWSVLVIWECETAHPAQLRKRLIRFMDKAGKAGVQ